MSWGPRQMPDVTPESEEYWSAAADETLKLKRCLECGNVFHYPRRLCPDCFGDTEWIESDGTGEIYSYSVSERSESWPDDLLPHVLAYVELDEGPRVMTVIEEADPEDISVGTRVEVAFRETEEDSVAIPVFVPAE